MDTMYIPLDERDYSKLSPQEIVIEAKKLLQEADEAIEDGRYGDAIELAAKAEELLRSVGKKVKEVVGFGKVVLTSIKSLKNKKEEEQKVIQDSLKTDSANVNSIALKIRTEIAPIDTTTPNNTTYLGLEDDTKEAKTQVERFKNSSDDHNEYLQAFETYTKKRSKIIKNEVVILLLQMYVQANLLNDLVEKIKKESEGLWKEYQSLEKSNKNEEEIFAALDPKIRQFLKTWYEEQLKKIFK